MHSGGRTLSSAPPASLLPGLSHGIVVVAADVRILDIEAKISRRTFRFKKTACRCRLRSSRASAPPSASNRLSASWLLRRLHSSIFSSMVSGDQLVDEHRLVLADAVGAVGGLILDGRIPPGIIVDHRVGGGEVEADAAGFQADQEERHFAALERLDRLGAVRVSPVSSDVADRSACPARGRIRSSMG